MMNWLLESLQLRRMAPPPSTTESGKNSKQDDVPAPDLAPESIPKARRSPRIHQEDRYDPCLQSDEDEEEHDDPHPLPSSQPDTHENEKTTQEDAKKPTTASLFFFDGGGNLLRISNSLDWSILRESVSGNRPRKKVAFSL